MGRGVVAQRSFQAGELSPKVAARAETDAYAWGLRTLENALSRAQGGVVKRSGTVHLGQAKFPGRKVRLIDWEASGAIAYVIEMGHFYARYWTYDGLAIDGMTGLPIETVTPWSEDDLAALQWAQDFTTMYIVHPNYPPQKLTGATLNQVSFTNGRAPLDSFNVSVSNIATVTGSWPNMTVTTVNNQFTAADVGRTYYHRDTATPTAFYGVIASVTAANEIDVTGQFRFPASATSFAASSRWALGLFSSTMGCSAVALHEGRLVYGGFKRRPDLIYLSVASAFDNFELESPDPETTDAENADKAIARRLVSKRANAVTWLAGVNGTLLAGTDGGDFIIAGGDADILTPLTASAKQTTARGSSAVQPRVIDDQIFTIARGGGRVRQVSYSAERDGYVSGDAASFAEHITAPGVTELAYQQFPYGVLWGVTQVGGLFGFTVERDRAVLGAHRHILGGEYDYGPPLVQSAAVLPGKFVSAGPAPLLGPPDRVEVFANPTFTAGTVAPWVSLGGDWTLATAYGGLNAIVGQAVASDPTQALCTLVQQTVLSTIPGFNPTLVDYERTTLRAIVRAGWVSDPTASGTAATIVIRALTAGDDSLGDVVSLSYGVGDAIGSWIYQEIVVTAPIGTRKLLAKIDVTGTPDTAIFAIDTCYMQLWQQPVIYPKPPQVRNDTVFLAVQRTAVDGSSLVTIERMADEFDPGLLRSPSARRAAVEGAVFVDASTSYVTRVLLSDVSGNPAVVRTATPHGLVEGDRVTFRKTRWRRDGVLVSDVADFDSFVVGTVLSHVRFQLKHVDGTAVNTVVDLGEYVPANEAGASVLKQLDSVNGLGRFAGRTVSILADGGAREGVVQEDGSLVLDPPAAVTTVGLPYRMRATTLPRIGYGGAEGDDTGQPTSFEGIVLKFLNTIGGEVGRGDEPALPEPAIMASWDDPVDRPPVLYTGDQRLPIASVSDEDPVITYTHSDPYPAEVLGIYLCAKANMP